MDKKYIVTYDCFGDNERAFVWDASQVRLLENEENAFQRVIQFCNGMGHIASSPEDAMCVVDWGFLPCEEPDRYKAQSLRLPVASGILRREILKPIAQFIAEESTTNRELYLTIMKFSYQFAGGRDHDKVNLELSYGNEKDALQKAFCYRDTVSFMELEIDAAPELATEILAMLVEEFADIRIVDIMPIADH